MSRSTKKGRTKRLQNGILETGRQQFEAGDYGAILNCMWLCTFWRIQPPDWLIDAFCDRVGSRENFETWDDAFGPPMPPGTKKARREEIKNFVPLALKIRELRARGIRGQALYEQAADDLKLKGDWQTVRDAYYRRLKNLRDSMEEAASELEAERREGIRLPGGRLAVSDKEYAAWHKNYWRKRIRLHLRRNHPR